MATVCQKKKKYKLDQLQHSSVIICDRHFVYTLMYISFPKVTVLEHLVLHRMYHPCKVGNTDMNERHILLFAPVSFLRLLMFFKVSIGLRLDLSFNISSLH